MFLETWNPHTATFLRPTLRGLDVSENYISPDLYRPNFSFPVPLLVIWAILWPKSWRPSKRSCPDFFQDEHTVVYPLTNVRRYPQARKGAGSGEPGGWTSQSATSTEQSSTLHFGGFGEKERWIHIITQQLFPRKIRHERDSKIWTVEDDLPGLKDSRKLRFETLGLARRVYRQKYSIFSKKTRKTDKYGLVDYPRPIFQLTCPVRVTHGAVLRYRTLLLP